MKQTAVEWLYEKIWKEFNFSFSLNILEEAKEIQKQSIIDFTKTFINEHTYGDYNGNVQINKTVEEYYNEQFKQL